MAKPKLTEEQKAAKRDAAWKAKRHQRDVRKGQNPDDWQPIGLVAAGLKGSPAPADLNGLTMMAAYKALGLIVEEKDEEGRVRVQTGKGFIIDPRFVLNLAYFDLDGIDYAIIERIAYHHWKWADLPHPNVGTVASSLRFSPKAVSDRLRRMERLGYLRILPREKDDGTDASNYYDFRPLVYAQVAVEREIQGNDRKTLDRILISDKSWQWPRAENAESTFGAKALRLGGVPPPVERSTPSGWAEGHPAATGSVTLRLSGVEVDIGKADVLKAELLN